MLNRRFLLVATLAMGLAPARALAGEAPDFTGTWQLDRKASDSVDPILKAQGVGWLKRRIIGGLDMTQRIQQSGSTIDVVMETSAKTETHHWIVDGKPHVRTLDDGREATSVHHFEGPGLVTTTTGISEGGDPYTLHTTRTLADDGQTMKVALVCTIGGATLKATRLFRRA